jgi:hypothetical protein
MAEQTFLSGFAQAFNAARARTEEQNADQENLIFKYKMDNLMQMKEKREKRKAEETENSKKAQDLAGQLGDPDSASVFYKELSNGVSYETVQKRIVEGSYQKNENWKTPTQTVKVPTAVTMTYDAEANPTAPEQKGLFAQGKQRAYDRQMESVNKRIDQIDPTLRTESIEDTGQTTTTDDANTKYVLKPKNEYKIGDYGDALWELNQAKQSGDPKRVREAQDKVEIHQRIMTEKAKSEAIAQGKNVSTYLSINEDGTIGAQLPGELRDDGLYNVVDPTRPQKVSGPVIRMSDDDVKRLNQLTDDFGKQSKDYNAASQAFVGALDSSQKMAQILFEDPDAATMSSKGLGLIESLSGEAQAAYKAISDMENNINSRLESGKTDGIEKDIADHAMAVEKFIERGVLSDKNQSKVVNAAKFRSLQMQTAYQIAQATSTDGKVSNQDVANALEIIGSNSDPKQIIPVLNSQMQGAFLKLQSVQDQLNNNPSVADFENRYRLPNGKKIDTGLRGRRIGQQIDAMNIPPEQKTALHQYLKQVNSGYVQGQAETKQSLDAQQQQAPQGVEFNGLVIPTEAVDILKGKSDKRMKDFFDQQFGKGAADRVLGGK